MRVEASELRIGNYLQGTEISIPSFGIYSDGVLQISAYGIFQISEGNLCHYEPIPLTEEWLEKFEFHRIDIEMTYRYEYKHLVNSREFKVHGNMKCEHKMPYFYEHGGVDLEYVHSLQNLFYALCGEELVMLK